MELWNKKESKKMPGTKPTKKELARMKVMQEIGESPTAIARRLGRSHNTVIKYLESDVFNDPDIGELVERIRKKEVEDLYLLGAKGRQRLHELLDRGDSKMIETIALVDRTFQQRRLLEGRSTLNVNSLSALVIGADKEFAKGTKVVSDKQNEPIAVTPTTLENKAEGRNQ